jgi:hypothetical protein
VGEDQRDDLRVLVLEERHELADVRIAQRGEGDLGVDDVEPGEDALGLVLTEAGRQDLAGEVHAATADEVLRGHQVVELVHDAVDVLGLDGAQAHQLPGQGLDLARAELGQDGAGLLLAHLRQEDGGLAHARQLRARRGRRHRGQVAAPEAHELLDAGDAHGPSSLLVAGRVRAPSVPVSAVRRPVMTCSRSASRAASRRPRRGAR